MTNRRIYAVTAGILLFQVVLVLLLLAGAKPACGMTFQDGCATASGAVVLAPAAPPAAKVLDVQVSGADAAEQCNHMGGVLLPGGVCHNVDY